MATHGISTVSHSSQRQASTALQRLKPYATYKDSGFEWLGEIPAHWDVKRLKFLAPIRISKLDKKPDDAIYVGLENIESRTGRLLLENQPEIIDSVVTVFMSGDVLLGKLRPYLAKAARPAFDGVCTSEILPLYPSAGYFQSYIMYSLLNGAYIMWLDSLTYGTKMPRVSPEQVGSSFMSVPPEPEQRAIATFLDRETARIDVLVAKNERLIELLQEKRTALITLAVTKGLDPTVPMKDSGVEWLGEIPAHWEVKRLKNLAVLNPEVLPEDTDPTLEISYVDIGGVDSLGRIIEREQLTFTSAPTRARRLVRDGDVIVSTVRTYLRAIASINEPVPGMVASTGFAVIRPKNELTTDYAAYALRASYFVERVVANSKGVSFPAINESEIATYELAAPPEPEQEAIAAFLDREAARIDALVAKVREAIDRLKEYRTALISASVTGKIDVRGEAA